MNKLGLSAGLTFSPYKNLEIDFAFLYIQGFSRHGNYTSQNVVIPGRKMYSPESINPQRSLLLWELRTDFNKNTGKYKFLSSCDK